MKTNHSVVEAFRPVTITFELETPEELATLWHLLNNPVDAKYMKEVVAASSLHFIPLNTGIGCKLWNAVDRAVDDSGLRASSQ